MPTTYRDLLAQVKSQISEVDAAGAESMIEDAVTDRDEPIVIDCAAGARSAFAAQSATHRVGHRRRDFSRRSGDRR